MSILDRFNARDLSATEVATTFVHSPKFEALCQGSNSLVIGPRGSGKTTLLKMLTPEGSEGRRRAQMSDVGPQFLGIYIPFDVQLAETLEQLGTSRLDPQLAEVGIEALFSYHAFRSIVASAAWFCGSSDRHSQARVLSSSDEAALIAELSALWDVHPEVPTAGTMLAALRRTQVRATEMWRAAAIAGKYGLEYEPKSFSVVDFDGGMKGGAEALVRHVAAFDGRVAMLFDEVELAPSGLQTSLLGYLRHSSEHILFKVAISPYMRGARGLSDRLVPSAIDDYDTIDLSTLDGDDLRVFTERYFDAAASRRGVDAASFHDALGTSVLSPGPSERRSSVAYGPSVPQSRAVRDLYRKDRSFAKYVDQHGLNPTDLAADGDSDVRAPFRKVRQVVLIRNSYFSSAKARRIKTKHDARRLYCGAETVMNLCEGNPRRLALIVPMLLDGVGRDGRVPHGVQMAAIDRTEAAFRSFLRGLPVSKNAGQKLPRGVLTFIDILGESFHAHIVGLRFDADPVGSFIVHASASDVVEELVARAVNAGALVQLSDGSNRGSVAADVDLEPLQSSRGKRFRLSYLLSPHYGLPVRVSRANSLETILREVQSTSNAGLKVGAAAALLDTQGTLL